MERSSNPLIDRLVADLVPVAPMRAAPAVGQTLAATVVAIAAIGLLQGLRGHVTALFLLSSGLFLVLGLAASLAVIAMARPQVGSDRSGWNSSWGWATAMAMLLPVTTLLMALPDGAAAWHASDPAVGLQCLAAGLAAGLATGAVLVAWLRRGAPTSPERAGFVIGIAAGSLGIFAVSLHCPDDGIYHIGLWHSLPVAAAALLGRLAVPRLVRW